MQGEALVELDGASKRYPDGSGMGRLQALWQALRGSADGAQHRGFTALMPTTLQVRRGESTGLVGVNGAGKSTLLKLIAGVLRPSAGRVWVRGRVGALLELGAGFHPDYTGRQNLELAAALAGMGAGQLRERFDEIVRFADIGEHIDRPVRQYSSGMVVRLGFAVATALRPDVLITDEVLAVGDESFQRRCIAWMEAYLRDGGTLLLCSHSMYHIQKLCQRALWVHEGAIRMDGASAEVVQAYQRWHEERVARQSAGPQSPLPLPHRPPCRVVALQVGEGGAGEPVVAEGGRLLVRAEIHTDDEQMPHFAVGVVRANGTPVFGMYSDAEGVRPWRLGPRRWAFAMAFEPLTLLPGGYVVRAHAMDAQGMRLFDTVERSFMVSGRARQEGYVRLPHRWLGPQELQALAQAVSPPGGHARGDG